MLEMHIIFFPPVFSTLTAPKVTQIGDCVLHLPPERSSRGCSLWGRSVLHHKSQEVLSLYPCLANVCESQLVMKAPQKKTKLEGLCRNLFCMGHCMGHLSSTTQFGLNMPKHVSPSGKAS